MSATLYVLTNKENEMKGTAWWESQMATLVVKRDRDEEAEQCFFETRVHNSMLINQHSRGALKGRRVG